MFCSYSRNVQLPQFYIFFYQIAILEENETSPPASPEIEMDPPVPKPRTMVTPVKRQTELASPEKRKSVEKFSPRLVQSEEVLQSLRDDLELALSPENPELAVREKIFKTPPRKEETVPRFRTPQSGLKTPKLKKTPSYLRPTSASKHRSSPKKNPITNETMDVTICSRHGYAHTVDPSPSPVQQTKKRIPCSIDLDKIVSPVAQYIRSHPAPPLIRQVKPTKKNKFAVEDAISAECHANTDSGSPAHFSALPEAVYKSSKITREIKTPDFKMNRELPKSFGKVDQVEAVVSYIS